MSSRRVPMAKTKKKSKAMYQVEAITDQKTENGTVYYHVKWEGYPESESTWEPLEHVSHCLELLDTWNAQRADRLGLFNQRDMLSDMRNVEPRREPPTTIRASLTDNHRKISPRQSISPVLRRVQSPVIARPVAPSSVLTTGRTESPRRAPRVLSGRTLSPGVSGRSDSMLLFGRGDGPMALSEGEWLLAAFLVALMIMGIIGPHILDYERRHPRF